MGIEPMTLELLAPRSNQTELCGLLIFYFTIINSISFIIYLNLNVLFIGTTAIITFKTIITVFIYNIKFVGISLRFPFQSKHSVIK